jgi:hypothetical protein
VLTLSQTNKGGETINPPTSRDFVWTRLHVAIGIRYRIRIICSLSDSRCWRQRIFLPAKVDALTRWQLHVRLWRCQRQRTFVGNVMIVCACKLVACPVYEDGESMHITFREWIDARTSRENALKACGDPIFPTWKAYI